MLKIIEEYKKKVIKFNPEVKVLVARKTLQTWDLFKENINSVSSAHSLMRKNFVYCQKCQTYKSVQVHHINRNRKDNRLQNFALLCKKCHIHIHYFKIKNEIQILDLQGWTEFKQTGFANLSTYPDKIAEEAFVKILKLCQK